MMKGKREKGKGKMWQGRILSARTLIFSALLCVLCVKINALDLEEARLLALANSRSLAKYEMSIRSSILDEKNQLYSMLPQISAGYSASSNYLQNWEFVNPVDTISAGATFSITQVIFQGGKSFIQRAISQIQTESTRISALAEYYSVLDSCDNAYYAMLEAAATLEAEESSLRAAELSLSIAEVRQSTGMINTGDYLKALADKEARENSRNQARRNLALNESKLRALIGVTGPIQPEPINMDYYEDALTRLASISDEEAEELYKKLWNMLVESNLSLKRAAISNEIAEANLSLVKRDLAPTITASIFSSSLNFSVRNQNNSLNQGSISLGNGFTSSSSGGITIRGTIPLDFWILKSRIEKSEMSRDSAQIDYENTYSSLETDLYSALLGIFAQAGSVLSSRRSLEYTERHFEYVMERYRLSQSSVSEMTDASSLFISSRNNHIRSTYSFLQSLSRLRSLCALNDEAELLKLLVASD